MGVEILAAWYVIFGINYHHNIMDVMPLQLFYLITDHYPASNVRDIRRYAYEIFSTFLIPNAPLQVPNITQPIIQTIDKVLRTGALSSSSPFDMEKMKYFLHSFPFFNIQIFWADFL
jgi:hypothetical protein